MEDEMKKKVVALLGLLDDKTDSISVSKTSTGKFSWDVKIYTTNLMDDQERDRVICKIEAVDKKLRLIFKDAIKK